jgi:hypothetical protein
MGSTAGIAITPSSISGRNVCKFLAWATKHLLLPLTPFITGAIIRAVAGMHGYQDVFDVGELSFSMAMLCLLVVASASRVSDQHLRESLVGIWIVPGVIFLALFALSTFAKVQIDSGMKDLLLSVQRTASTGGQLGTFPVPDQAVEKFARILQRVWLFVVIPAILTSFFAAACKFAFKLED